MWKYLSCGIFDNCLPSEKVFTVKSRKSRKSAYLSVMLQLHKKRSSKNKLMKPRRWRLSWCTILFITASDFWRRLEPFHRTILGRIFVKCSYFLKHFCSYVFQVSLLSLSKKEKDERDFQTEFFAFTYFGWGS